MGRQWKAEPISSQNESGSEMNLSGIIVSNGGGIAPKFLGPLNVGLLPTADFYDILAATIEYRLDWRMHEFYNRA